MRRNIYRLTLYAACALFMLCAAGQARALTLVAAVGSSLPPYVIVQDNAGIELDIVRKALFFSGYRIQLKYMPYGFLPVALRNEKVDVALTVNEDMDVGQAVLSEPHVTYRNVAVSLASRNLAIDSIADLGKYRVVCFQDGPAVLGPVFSSAAKASLEYVELNNQREQAARLFAGETDVIVTDEYIFNYFRKQVKRADASQPVTLHRIFEPSRFSLGCVSPAVCAAFNKGVARLRDTGEYEAIINRYIK